MNYTKTSKSLHRVMVGAAATALAAYGAMFGEPSSSGDTQADSQQSGAMASPAVSEDLVRSVQERLRARDVNGGPVDGIGGAETQEGLRWFQQSQGFAATGQLNAETLQQLGVTGQRGEAAARPGTAAQGAAAPGAPAQGRIALGRGYAGVVIRGAELPQPRRE